MKPQNIVCMVFIVLLGLCFIAYADDKDDIGYTRLQTELGSSMPDGSGVRVTHVEAMTTDDAWMPDPTNPEFSGKTMNFYTGSTPEIYSGHATSVGRRFYGLTTSMAPGIGAIDCYAADYWLGSDFLYAADSRYKPEISPNRVANHSWIGETDDPDIDSDILRRLDWIIETDEFIQAVGLRNSSPNIPLLGTAYNAIAVGCSDGEHGIGSASLDDSMDDVYLPQRTRPDIVAPLSTTSAATPVVAAASALLIELGHNDMTLSTDPSVQSTTNRNGDIIYNAERSEVIKAVLMAGAHRYIINDSGSSITDYRLDPANQTANGLDSRFGSGQLNIYNSYHILDSGEQNSFEDDLSSQGIIDYYGFDYDPFFGGSNDSNDEASYYFTADSNVLRLSAALIWNLDIDGGNRFLFEGSATLHDLNLFLYDVTEPGNPLLMGSSESIGENSEHLWIPLENNHDYVIQVRPKEGFPAFEWDYALAWQIQPLKNGDLDGDGDADGLDLAAFKDTLGSLDGDPEYDPLADFEGDGAIDESDLFRFAVGFGRIENGNY